MIKKFIKDINPMENSNEIWKPIKGYEGLYEVSNLGRIKSLTRLTKSKGNGLQRTPEKILRIYALNNKLPIVSLFKENKCIRFNVPNLVLESFLGIKSSCIIYKDQNSLNNCLSNLHFSGKFICTKCNKEFHIVKPSKKLTTLCISCRDKREQKKRNKQYNNYINTLDDRYIIERLKRSDNLVVSEISPEIIETKRNIIKIKRLCRQLKN